MDDAINAFVGLMFAFIGGAAFIVFPIILTSKINELFARITGSLLAFLTIGAAVFLGSGLWLRGSLDISGALGLASFTAGTGAGWYYQTFGAGRSRRRKRREIAKKTADMAARSAAYWGPDAIKALIESTITSYVSTWNNLDSSDFSSFMGHDLAAHQAVVRLTLKELGRSVKIKRKLREYSFIDVVTPEEGEESFTALLWLEAWDVVTDNIAGTKDDLGRYDIEANFRFVRTGDNWVLTAIEYTPASLANVRKVSDEISGFARNNELNYSQFCDLWFTPEGGYLFGGGNTDASFASYSLNGVFNQKTLQLYALERHFSEDGGPVNFYVSQLSLPREYGKILILKRGIVSDEKYLIGLRKYVLEWPDFNSKFDVYCSDEDRLATFELLNPSFMSSIYDINVPLSIEVVGRTVTFYAAQGPSAELVATLLQLTKRAAKELAQ